MRKNNQHNKIVRQNSKEDLTMEEVVAIQYYVRLLIVL
jgi:hypothetical protein